MTRAAGNRAAALAATVAILALMIRLAPARHDRAAAVKTPASASPTQHLERFLDSARRGDVSAYLDSLGGDFRDRVEREVDEAGRAAFADRLRLAARASKSHAVFAPEPAGDGVAIAVDSVQADRQARSVYRLEPAGPGWRIVAIERTQELFPRSARGAVATYAAPEANPMSSAVDADPKALEPSE